MNDQSSLDLPRLSVSEEGHSLASLLLLEKRLRERYALVSAWFEKQWKETPPPLYGSVDLRNAGFKLAPVDMNLFPAGFNNLNPRFLTEAVQAAKQAIQEAAPNTKLIGLIPESFTRNFLYWENISVLANLLEQAGFEVKLGSLNAEVREPSELHLQSGKSLLLEPLTREQNRLRIGDSFPDLLLLNNDLSTGIPPLLAEVEQLILPPAALGWHQRLKSLHFQYYARLGREFAEVLDLDPWLFTPLFRNCGEIDFMNREGMECLIQDATVLLADIERKYEEYGVKHKPFIIVKADAGTQGMAVMTVRHMDDLALMNRKHRTSMAKSKGGVPVRSVLIQEGVYSFESFGSEGSVAEPVVYLWGKQVIGGFFRIHQDRGRDENLNAPGMQFESLPFAWSCSSCDGVPEHPYQEHLFTYGVIAQLSMLAAAKEIAGG